MISFTICNQHNVIHAQYRSTSEPIIISALFAHLTEGAQALAEWGQHFLMKVITAYSQATHVSALSLRSEGQSDCLSAGGETGYRLAL